MKSAIVKVRKALKCVERLYGIDTSVVTIRLRDKPSYHAAATSSWSIDSSGAHYVIELNSTLEKALLPWRWDIVAIHEAAHICQFLIDRTEGDHKHAFKTYRKQIQTEYIKD